MNAPVPAPAPFAPPVRYASRSSIVGEDTQIRRALPNRERRMVGAWCFLDHLGPVQFAPGKGMHVGPHPHIGLQTFTWMIEGEVVHRDSLGYEQVIRPGQVNLMTAGRGIAHTEDSAQQGATLHAAQLWIALPEAEKNRAPAFQNYADLPAADAGGWRATVLAGTALGLTAPTQVYTPLVGVDLVATGAAETTLALQPDFEYGAMVLRGSAELAGESVAIGELLYLAPGRSELTLRCSAAAQVLLLGGQPFGEPMIVWWNFVARTQGEIDQAVADWNAGHQRFGTVRAGSTAQPLVPPSLEGVQLRASRDGAS